MFTIQRTFLFTHGSSESATLPEKKSGEHEHGSIGGKLYFNCQGVGGNNKSFISEFGAPSFINYLIAEMYTCQEIQDSLTRFSL